MKDEIKEILGGMSEYLEEKKKDYEEIVIKNGFSGDSIVYEVYYEDIKTLFDYITNLQEENERLKKLCDKYEEEHNTTFQKWLKELKGGEK